MRGVRLLSFASLYLALAPASAAGITTDVARVDPLGAEGRWTGFRVLDAADDTVAEVRFGSLDQITAARAETGADGAGPWLRFSALTAVPTPDLDPSSTVTVRLYPADPYPQVSFRLVLRAFDPAAWQAAAGTVPFHFLACALPGAEIFHHRGWSIMTPVLDPYPLHNQATGYGRQITSEWSDDWTYAPPVGAWPVATVGLWQPAQRRYAGFDFHGARLTDHSEQDVAASYVWRQAGAGPLAGRALDQFFTLVWPYPRNYRTGLRYPQLPEQAVMASHLRLLHSTALPAEEDPNHLVQQFLWSRYRPLLPAVPPVADMSWLPDGYRPDTFPVPHLPGALLHRIGAQEAQWWEPGALVFHGLGWDGDPVGYAHETGQTAALARLKQQIGELLPYARQFEVDGQPCVAWQQCLEGEGKLSLFGPGVPTVRHVDNWQLGRLLLDVYAREPEAEARLLPYVDGLLRWTRAMLTTRNGYPDVPTAQFCWDAGPVTTFCLRYWLAFRGAADADHRELAQLAYQLAHRMLYRNLTVWASDSNDLDALDSSFLFEPNAGISWLGAACSNEVWVVMYALAQTYVHTGDPILGHYLLGANERWHELYRDEHHPTLRAYGGALTERLGLYEGSAQPPGTRADFGGLWGLAEWLLWPVGSAEVRVVAGEKAAFATTKGNRLVTVADYRYGGEGEPSFRLATASDFESEQPFDLMVTVPQLDVRDKAVFVVAGGEAERLPEERVVRYPQRPDSLLVRGMRLGETVALGAWRPEAPVLPTEVAKSRRRVTEPAAAGDENEVRWPAGFTTVALRPNRSYSLDWRDPASLAGWEPGQKTLYGVPFRLADPRLQPGALALRDGPAAIDAVGSHLFALVGEAGPAARLRATFADGSTAEAALGNAFPALRGWPPLFGWHVDWVELPLAGKRLRSLEARDLSLFAATVSAVGPARTAATLAAAARERAADRTRTETVRRIAELAPLFERASGHIAILPGPGAGGDPRRHPLARLIHQAGLSRHVTFLTPRQMVDPEVFNAREVWVALYLTGESFPRSVQGQRDGEAALRRFLGAGGTLLVLPQPGQPYPFYYNEAGRAEPHADQLGLHLVNPWEQPPADHAYTFRRRGQPSLLPSLPASFPFPQQGDPRFRGLDDRYGGTATYTPLLTLYDEAGQRVADAAAWIEFAQGDLAGGRIGFAWATLLGLPDTQMGLLHDLLAHALATAQPGAVAAACPRTVQPVVVDGQLDEPVWRHAQAIDLGTGPSLAPPRQPTQVRCAWDAERLYLGFSVHDAQPVARGARDGELSAGDVVTAVLDPDGDGRDVVALSVNPLGTPRDARAAAVESSRGAEAAAWNAPGWLAAAQPRVTGGQGWTAELSVPFADLGVAAPSLGGSWQVDFARRDVGGAEPEVSGWSARPPLNTIVFGADPHHDDFSLYPDDSAPAPTWRARAGTWTVQGGVLTGADSGGDGWVPEGLRLQGARIADGTLTVRFRLAELGSDHRDGLWLGVRASGEASYSLHLTRAGAFLHKAAGGASTNDDQPLARAAFTPDDRWHTLALTLRGPRLTTRLDGLELLSATDANALGLPPLGPGGVVLSARRWSGGTGQTRIEVDEVMIGP